MAANGVDGMLGHLMFDRARDFSQTAVQGRETLLSDLPVLVHVVFSTISYSGLCGDEKSSTDKVMQRTCSRRSTLPYGRQTVQ